MELATPFSMPSIRMTVLVTNKSSPTNCTCLPRRSVSSFQPAQSSSAMPSSIETLGLFFVLLVFFLFFCFVVWVLFFVVWCLWLFLLFLVFVVSFLFLF